MKKKKTLLNTHWIRESFLFFIILALFDKDISKKIESRFDTEQVIEADFHSEK